MIKFIHQWLVVKWRLIYDNDAVIQAYALIPDTVVQHLVDNIYCKVCESNDPIALARHNGAREVVHTILENIDYGRNAGKYRVRDMLVAQQSYNGVSDNA